MIYFTRMLTRCVSSSDGSTLLYHFRYGPVVPDGRPPSVLSPTPQPLSSVELSTLPKGNFTVWCEIVDSTYAA